MIKNMKKDLYTACKIVFFYLFILDYLFLFYKTKYDLFHVEMNGKELDELSSLFLQIYDGAGGILLLILSCAGIAVISGGRKRGLRTLRKRWLYILLIIGGLLLTCPSRIILLNWGIDNTGRLMDLGFSMLISEMVLPVIIFLALLLFGIPLCICRFPAIITCKISKGIVKDIPCYLLVLCFAILGIDHVLGGDLYQVARNLVFIYVVLSINAGIKADARHRY